MILSRTQVVVDKEVQLVEEMIDALAASGLPWLRDNNEHMNVEPGSSDLDITELEWLDSLTRNAKSILAATITSRFIEMKVWENHEYLRQLQIVVRIVSVIQEFRRLQDILQVAISNNTMEDSLALLITTVAAWHAPLEGMGLLPSLISAITLNVSSISAELTVVANYIRTSEAEYSNCHTVESFA
jgi:hypothetical protein